MARIFSWLIYFDTMAEAIEKAYDDARTRGYEIVEPGMIFQGVKYGETQRYTVELTKEGKLQRKCLTIVLYRTESGKYELTHYIN